jgi:predicted transcriptional regulator
MALSILSIKILECIRSKVRDPRHIAEELNVDFPVIKEHLNWLVRKKYITTEGRLTKKGFLKVPERAIKR